MNGSSSPLMNVKNKFQKIFSKSSSSSLTSSSKLELDAYDIASGLSQLRFADKYLPLLESRCQSLDNLTEEQLNHAKKINLSATVTLIIASEADDNPDYDSVSIYSDGDEVFDNNYTQQLNELITEQEQLLTEFDVNQPLPPLPTQHIEEPPIYENTLPHTFQLIPQPLAPRSEFKPKASERTLTRQDGIDAAVTIHVEDHYSIPAVDQNSNVPCASDQKLHREDSIYVTMTPPPSDGISKTEDHLQTPTAQLLNDNDNEENRVKLRKNLRAERKLQLVTIKRRNSALTALGRVVDRTEDPKVRYMLGDLIDEGASGAVYVSRDNDLDEVVAVKVIDVRRQNELGLIVKEIESMKMLTHPCIVNYLNSYLCDKRLWIVMEYLDGGSLTNFCKYVESEEWMIATILREILKGLEYLHSNKIIHRDIKSDNILISTSGAVKITDFGFCAQMHQEKQTRNTMGGTIHWMSPEVLQGQSYNEKTDLWSLGILAIELLEGEPPFMNDGIHLAMQKIKTGGRPRVTKCKVSPDLDGFLNQCLEKKVSQRASATSLLAHPFIAKNAKHRLKLCPIIEALQKKLYED